jgi:hypothetical protein
LLARLGHARDWVGTGEVAVLVVDHHFDWLRTRREVWVRVVSVALFRALGLWSGSGRLVGGDAGGKDIPPPSPVPSQPQGERPIAQ